MPSPDTQQQLIEENAHLKRLLDTCTEQLKHVDKISQANELVFTQVLQELNLLSSQLSDQNKQLSQENQRKSRELEEARQIQLALLPQHLPDLPRIQMAVFMQTATEVGGDYYDFMIQNDGTFTLAIGDATGHGLKAGMMVASTKSLFMTMAQETEPAQLLEKLSRAIKTLGFRRIFMAMSIAQLREQTLTFSSAGMPFPLVYHAKEQTLSELEVRGVPLGSFIGFPYTQHSLTLYPQDMILFMSDGLYECFNVHQEMLNDQLIKALFRKHAEKSPAHVINALQQATTSWCMGRPPHDDITLVALQMK